MVYSVYHEGNYKEPILNIEYKTYSGALKRLMRNCEKPLDTDYKKTLAGAFYTVIKDDLNRILVNCHFSGGEYIITIMDNIGRLIKQARIKKY